MKIIKKLSAMMLSLCLSLSCFSLVVFAADGRISFTDPETAVGEMVDMKCVVRAEGDTLGEIEVKLAYDSEALRFDTGENVTKDSAGALTCKATGSSSEATFSITFQALKEGETQVSVSGATIASSSGGTLTLDQGNSTVKIAAGDPSKIVQDDETSGNAGGANDLDITVGEETYKLSDSFADADIPAEFTKTEVQFEGQTRQMVTQESSGVTLGYLVNGNGEGDFFLYNEEDATFSPFAQVAISDQMSIVLLSDTSNVKLPDTYQEVTLTLNGKDFPVWQNTERDGFYVLHALNNSGDKEYYQYDSVEDTYQRFEAPKASAASDKADHSLIGKIKGIVSNHFQLLAIALGIAALIILILIIVLAAKLHNRNAELDELYDEYGIDEEEEPVVKKAPAVKAKKEPRANRKKDAFEEDEFEQIDLEDDFEEDDFEEDDLEESGLEESGYEEELFEEADFEEEEEEIEDLDELLSEQPEKRRGHIEQDDTFKVDFIDLD